MKLNIQKKKTPFLIACLSCMSLVYKKEAEVKEKMIYAR